MRLSDHEAAAIKRSIIQFDPEAELYLFGSRVDDNKKGGDIDLLVISGKITRADRRKIKLKIYDEIGEQRIDMIVTPKISTPFHRIALSEGVKL